MLELFLFVLLCFVGIYVLLWMAAPSLAFGLTIGGVVAAITYPIFFPRDRR